MKRAILFVVLTAASAVAGRGVRAQQPTLVPSDTGCGRYVRHSGRSELCARVVDQRTGRGVGGGHVEFVRDDGASMAGLISPNGEFGLNVPGGHGTLTIAWSCRPAVRLVDTLTLPPTKGVERVFAVSVAPQDTRCRVADRDLTDLSRGAVERWLARGPCFAIALGEWRPAVDTMYAPARWVRLETLARARHERPQGPPRALPLRDRPPRGRQWTMTGWRPLRGDSLELYWSSGFSAVSLTLGRPRKDRSGVALAGHGIWTFDVVVTDSLGFRDLTGLPNGPVSARRVACR